jgi:hypothetical protein
LIAISIILVFTKKYQGNFCPTHRPR